MTVQPFLGIMKLAACDFLGGTPTFRLVGEGEHESSATIRDSTSGIAITVRQKKKEVSYEINKLSNGR